MKTSENMQTNLALFMDQLVLMPSQLFWIQYSYLQTVGSLSEEIPFEDKQYSYEHRP